MSLEFQNNWKNIIDKLIQIFRKEFKNTLSVYTGEINEKLGSRYLRIDPMGNDLIEFNGFNQTREYAMDIYLYFESHKESKLKLDTILRIVSRVENLILNNLVITLKDDSKIINSRIESTELNVEKDNAEFYVVKFDYRCTHYLVKLETR